MAVRHYNLRNSHTTDRLQVFKSILVYLNMYVYIYIYTHVAVGLWAVLLVGRKQAKASGGTVCITVDVHTHRIVVP